MNDSIPIACDITVLPLSAQKQTVAILSKIFESVQTVQELPDGYVFHFPNEGGKWMELAQFVDRERQCCSFLHFTLEAEPNSGPFLLRITGNDEVKQFLQTTMITTESTPQL